MIVNYERRNRKLVRVHAADSLQYTVHHLSLSGSVPHQDLNKFLWYLYKYQLVHVVEYGELGASDMLTFSSRLWLSSSVVLHLVDLRF